MVRSGTSQPTHPGGRARRAAWTALAAALVVAIAGLATGCAAPAVRSAPPIKLSSAQVSQPGAGGVTDIYVDVQNSGAADELVGARLSVGGAVTLRSPARPGVIEMRTVRVIAIPAKSDVGLDPNGPHLLVTDAGKMISGHQITLTLIFAHAGAVSVPAMVTDPATGGTSYFLN
ncbi:MAG TPA: copper chaperone PCu(A)C [Streptosporangiaceae bacterium]|nr:copper chaperone PCu(A)C [Streptosporangiaceae bacterium]